jgi:YHS domain-containing protein
MFRFHSLFALPALLALPAVGLITLAGCSKEPAGSTSTPAVSDTAAEEASPSDVPAPFADLDEADRAAAMAQKVCPVSGEALGSMGTPIKVTVEGRDVYLCCESCRDMLLADPEKYLAKLDAE